MCIYIYICIHKSNMSKHPADSVPDGGEDAHISGDARLLLLVLLLVTVTVTATITMTMTITITITITISIAITITL